MMLRVDSGNGMADFTHARNAVVAGILRGDGRASHAQRPVAFDKAGLAEPVRTLTDKIARHAYTVTDEDIAGVRASGPASRRCSSLPARRERSSGARPCRRWVNALAFDRRVREEQWDRGEPARLHETHFVIHHDSSTPGISVGRAFGW
jgi:hypothetical protein